MFPQKNRYRIVPGVAAIALLGAACGSSSGGVEATGAWARTSPMMADAGAAYMVLSSDEAVTIVSASVPAEVAGKVEIHEVVPVESSMESDMEDGSMESDDMEHEGEMDEDSMGGDDMEGEGEMGQMSEMPMMMQEVPSLQIPAGGSVTLEPGGYHVMLLELPDALETGEKFEVTFTQDDGESFSVEVEVREDAP